MPLIPAVSHLMTSEPVAARMGELRQQPFEFAYFRRKFRSFLLFGLLGQC